MARGCVPLCCGGCGGGGGGDGGVAGLGWGDGCGHFYFCCGCGGDGIGFGPREYALGVAVPYVVFSLYSVLLV